MSLPNTEQGVFLAHSVGKIPWGSLNLSMHSTESSVWWFHSHVFAFPVLFSFCHSFPFYSAMIIKTKALPSFLTCVIPSCILFVAVSRQLAGGLPWGRVFPVEPQLHPHDAVGGAHGCRHLAEMVSSWGGVLNLQLRAGPLANEKLIQ